MRARWLLAVALLAGCGPETERFSLALDLRRDGDMACPASINACEDFVLGCRSLATIRIVDAANPTRVFVDECFELAAGDNLCDLATTALPEEALPSSPVQIQVAVWPAGPGVNECPRDLSFDANGLPDPSDVNAPAIGGALSIAPSGGATAVVRLACVDPTELSAESCIPITATVTDFSTLRPVVENEAVANGLVVYAVEPTLRFDASSGAYWEIEKAAQLELVRPPGGQLWLGETDPERPFQDFSCAIVDDDRGSVFKTLTCQLHKPMNKNIDLFGVRIDKTRQDQILGALGISDVPNGVVIGRVVNNAVPLAGVQVVGSMGAQVSYLDAAGTAIDTFATVTTASGLFISPNAPPQTEWSIRTDTGSSIRYAVGGRARFHVTTIIIDRSKPPLQ